MTDLKYIVYAGVDSSGNIDENLKDGQEFTPTELTVTETEYTKNRSDTGFSEATQRTYRKTSNLDDSDYSIKGMTLHRSNSSGDTIDIEGKVSIGNGRIYNAPYYGTFEVLKTDEYGNPLQGAVLELTANTDIKDVSGTYTLYKAGDVIAHEVTDKNGIATFGGANAFENGDEDGCGKYVLPCTGGYYYTVKEVTAPKNYVVDPSSYVKAKIPYPTPKKMIGNCTNCSADEDGYIVGKVKYYPTDNSSIINIEPYGQLTMSKIDSETGNTPHVEGLDYPQHGDASLDGAVYGLYSTADLKNANGDVTILKGGTDPIAEFTLNEYGVPKSIEIKQQIEEETWVYYIGKLEVEDGELTFGDVTVPVKYLTHLPLGDTYYFQEISPPTNGYNSNSEKYFVSLSVDDVGDNGYVPYNLCTDDGTYSNVITATDEVIEGYFMFYKISVDDATLAQNVHDAEFTAILASYVDANYNGNASEAVNHIEESGLKNNEYSVFGEYDRVNEDEDHLAIYKSDTLAYGTYYVVETETPDGLSPVNNFTVNISEDETYFTDDGRTGFKVTFFRNDGTQIGDSISGKDYNLPDTIVNDTSLTMELRIVKQDSETGDKISYNGAIFEIYAEEDNREYNAGDKISQKIGNTTYSAFRVNADGSIGFAVDDSYSADGYTYTLKDDEKGTVWLPLSLTVGTYRLHEVYSPYGYLELPSDIIFSLNGDNSTAYFENSGESVPTETNTDADGETYLTIVAEDQPVYGELDVTKKLVKRDNVDISIVDTDLSNVEFKLTANEDILDLATASVLIEKGNTAYLTKESSGVYSFSRENPNSGDTVIHPDKNGNIKITGLPLGSYTLTETKTVDGGVIDKNDKGKDISYDVTFTQTDTVTKTIEVDYSVTNYTTEVDISKTTVNGDFAVGSTVY